jgi:CRISPR/Cas system CSM-associated protein Csm3 (group 7 of RAMP superfamily)
VLRNSEDFPIIPGSSIKGCFGLNLNGFCGDAPLRSATIPDVCYSSRWLKEHPEKRDKAVDPCLVCQIFGRGGIHHLPGSGMQLQRKSLPLSETGLQLIENQERLNQKYKYDLEAVPKGTVFSGDVTVENCTVYGQEYARLGGLLSLVEFFNACAGTMGHGVSRGYGEVEVRIKEISVISANDYLNGNYSGTTYGFGTPQYDAFVSQALAAWRTCVAGKKE